MSLIAGMDDIMAHIKNQEFRIKKLEVENKRLKKIDNKVNAFKKMLKATNGLEEDEEGWMETWDIIEETLMIDTAGEEINKLEEETLMIDTSEDVNAYIKKLEDENNKMNNGLDDIYKVFTTPGSKPYTTKIKEAKNIINQVKIQDNKSVIDYKKLYDEMVVENKKLKRANELNGELYNTCIETIKGLEEEIKKLKEEIEPLRQLKKEADEECECMASVMMKKCMDDIDEKKKQFQEEFQEECNTIKKNIYNQLANTTKDIICCLFDMKDYDIEDFVDKLNYVCCHNTKIDIVEICEMCNIELESDERLRELYYECGVWTEEFLIESMGKCKEDEDFKQSLKLINEIGKKRDNNEIYDEEENVEEFIEWYLNKEYSSYHYDMNSEYYFCIS